MICKGLSLLSVLVFAVSGASVRAEEERPDFRPICQVRLVKVASEALDREFARHGKKIGVINEVDFNYNLDGIPRVIFLGRSARDSNEVCFIDVRTITPGSPSPDGCPNYTFSEIRSNCP